MEETVDLREYFGIVKKRFWIVALITIIAVVVSGVISFFMLNPVYEAKSTLIVNTEKNEETQMITGDQFNVTQKLAVTYGEIIKSRSVLDDVIKNLKLDDEYGDLVKNIRWYIVIQLICSIFCSSPGHMHLLIWLSWHFL